MTSWLVCSDAKFEAKQAGIERIPTLKDEVRRWGENEQKAQE